MIEKAELERLAQGARQAGVTMAFVCKEAGKHRQSWSRAWLRGNANYTLIDPLWAALKRIEAKQSTVEG